MLDNLREIQLELAVAFVAGSAYIVVSNNALEDAISKACSNVTTNEFVSCREKAIFEYRKGG